MSKTISQTILFKNTTAAQLFALYMDAEKHSESTGVPAKISARKGSTFSVYDGYATGKNIHLEKNRLIVQSWRASDWKKSDPDSTFLLEFLDSGKDCYVNMIHAFVPDNQEKSLAKGWHDYYWKPWKKYLSGK